MGNLIVFLLCLVFVYTQVSWALPCHCGCDKPCEPPLVKPAPVLDLGYAPLPEPYVYKGPPLPVVLKEPYVYIPPVKPVHGDLRRGAAKSINNLKSNKLASEYLLRPAPIPEPCAGKSIAPAPCCPLPKHNKLGLLQLALEHGKLHCDCKKLPLKMLLCKHLLKKYQLLCGCV